MNRSEDADECWIEKNWFSLLERAKGAETRPPAAAGTSRSVVARLPPQEVCEVELRWTDLLSNSCNTTGDPDLPK
jgi:hypothetical protein